MRINEIVVKVTCVCNLSCRYCHVFNKSDKSYQNEPNVMSLDIVSKLLERIEEYCAKYNQKQMLLILHGGEPLLAGKEFYRTFVEQSKRIVKSANVGFSLQSNGTLVTDEWCRLFKELNIQVGISIDGDYASSKNRIFRSNGEEAFHSIMKGYEVLSKYAYPHVLSVCNTNVSPKVFYDYMKSIDIYFFDCLFPDANYTTPSDRAPQLGQWLIELFDIWYFSEDNQKPHIRLFELIIRLILGQSTSGNETVGRGYNGVIDIKADGTIDIVDSLKNCKDGKRRKEYNILHDSLDSIFENDVYNLYYNSHQDVVLCPRCQQCAIKDVCGGGHLSHRFSQSNGYDNPSIYCDDMLKLISHIQHCLVDDLPSDVVKQTQITKL